jgi:hypothetical protein
MYLNNYFENRMAIFRSKMEELAEGYIQLHVEFHSLDQVVPTYRMHGRDEKCQKICWEKEARLGDVGVDERIILNLIIKKHGVKMWTRLNLTQCRG